MRTSTLVVTLFSLGLPTFACGTSSSSTTAPTCAQLQTQINTCPGFSQADKDSLGPFCASARATDACRSCLDGHLCGVAEQCDPQCGKSSSDGGSIGDSGSILDSGQGDGSGTCGLAFFPSDYDKSCQGAMNSACCTQEKACGANADCVKLIACINACPAPRQDACVNACSGGSGVNTPGYTQLNAIGECSKVPPYKDPAGVSCSWPSRR